MGDIPVEQQLRHVLSTKELDVDFLQLIFETAKLIKYAHAHRREPNIKPLWNQIRKTLEGYGSSLVFHEPSTRTYVSFHVAMQLLGGGVIGTQNADKFSSAFKGETLSDETNIYGLLTDVVVLRHPQNGAARVAANATSVPLINAGDGAGEHPTQTLLDLFTIVERYPDRDNLVLVIAGDPGHSRTIRSLVYALSDLRGTKYGEVHKIISVASNKNQLSHEIIAYARERDIEVECAPTFTPEIMQTADVVYMTRAQRERLGRWSRLLQSWRNSLLKKFAPRTYEKAVCMFTLLLTRHLKKDATILHPLPRNAELPRAIDKLPQAYYFKQAANGLFVRMALLLWVFEKI